ncbi:MAG: hypothetical protein ABIN05_07875 [candidate division WOR-3 bacterium]
MTYKLFCQQNPQELGIADEKGNWHIDKLEEHIKTCKECQIGLAKLFAGMLYPDFEIPDTVSEQTREMFEEECERIYIHKCLRCEYTWESLLKRPKTCPKCKSYTWDEERKRRKK